jgi:hypothetical protein
VKLGISTETNTKRIDAGTPWRIGCEIRPRLRFRHNVQVFVEWGHSSREIFKEQIWRDDTMLHSQRRLHETGDAGGAFGMAYDSFHTANIQWIFVVTPLSATEEGI